MSTEKTAVGKVTLVRNKYILTVGKQKSELPVGTLIAKSEVKKLVGKNVDVAYATKPSSKIVAIRAVQKVALPKVKLPWVTCYVPAESVLAQVLPEARIAAVNKMVELKIISPSLGEELHASLQSE